MEIMRLISEWLLTAGQHTLAAGSLILAVIIFFYSLLDRRIPSIIIPPIVGVLVYFGAYTYGDLNGTKHEKAACTRRMNDAKQELYSKYAKAALTLRYIEDEYERSMNLMTSQQKEYQEELDTLLATLQQERAENLKEEASNETLASSNHSCLASPIPDSLLRNLNKSRG